MTRSLRTSAVCPAAVLLALVMGNGPALARQAGKQAPEAKPTAWIKILDPAGKIEMDMFRQYVKFRDQVLIKA